MKKRFLNLENFDDELSTLDAALSLAQNKDQMLTFRVSESFFAVEIQYVKEMVAYSPEKAPKKVPNLPDEIIGLMNLRGELVPVIDMRKKLKLPDKVYVKFDIIMVLEVKETVFGILVDEVDEMVPIPEEKVNQPEASGQPEDLLIKYLCSFKDQFIPVFDPEKLFPQTEYQRIKYAGQ